MHPEDLNLVQLIPQGVGGAVKNGINISLKNANRVAIYCFVEKGADPTQTTFTLQQSSGNAGSAAGTGEKALTDNVDIYISDDFALDNTLTKTTAAKLYQCAATQSVTQVVVFDIDPAACLDLANGFDCITVNASDPGAANSVCAFAVIDPRFCPMPTPFVD